MPKKIKKPSYKPHRPIRSYPYQYSLFGPSIQICFCALLGGLFIYMLQKLSFSGWLLLSIVLKLILWLCIAFVAFRIMLVLFVTILEKIKQPKLILGLTHLIIDDNIVDQFKIPYKKITGFRLLVGDDQIIEGIHIEHTTSAPNPLILPANKLSLEMLTDVCETLNEKIIEPYILNPKKRNHARATH